MIDKKYIGTKFPSKTVEVEKHMIRFFASAIGETNPIHSDEAAAKAAGYRSLVAPPTFPFCLNSLASGEGLNVYKEMGVNVARVLHGEQGFEYFEPICAGDVLRFEGSVTDIYDKKGGALDFITTETEVINQAGKTVARMRGVTVVRN
ncbi:MaoC family dehydratase N-terminal domain-containing protein [Zavarzinia sp. CC-PAN008]|uniref:MaoC family dehydratase N-terminal domain-containing protein n=1 Tax=Zavarzinia sp. CC-PAN008 TaxID=3243332 RepID=UPI003F74A54A